MRVKEQPAPRRHVHSWQANKQSKGYGMVLRECGGCREKQMIDRTELQPFPKTLWAVADVPWFEAEELNGWEPLR